MLKQDIPVICLVQNFRLAWQPARVSDVDEHNYCIYFFDFVIFRSILELIPSKRQRWNELRYFNEWLKT